MIAIDGTECTSISELAERNKMIKESPLYVKEMRRRAVCNIPGEITRDQWQDLVKVALPKNEEEVKKRVKERDSVKKVEVQIPTPEEAFEKEKKYTFNISPLHKNLLKSANRKGLAFELTGDQIESLLEKKCHFCGIESVTLITTGKKFDYASSKGVCGECKSVHDLLGEGMSDYLDRFVKC